jgi:CubicO group peptidase (beta-lactamase class C family)
MPCIPFRHCLLIPFLASLALLFRMSPEKLPPAATYYPSRDNWELRKPAELGMDEVLLAKAVEWAKAQKTNWPRALADKAPAFGRQLGPLPARRGEMNGIIIRKGYMVAEFGDTACVDPTYSVAKSYLSALLGLSVDRGLIRRITDSVGSTVKDGGYDSPHNAKVTWEHHARQTSEWDGTLFGKVHSFQGAEEFGGGAMPPRVLREPGTFFEYNDVRINRLSLSLLRLWKKPLPEVLKTEIMDPIGASDTWVYHGYDNSDVVIDGRSMKSVPGGTRWGGGLWISTRDQARFGYLMLRCGKWKDRQILAESWVKQATSRGEPIDPDYGYLWWLNTQGQTWADAPKTSFAALGAGSNTLWVDPDHELVVVWRWHAGDPNEFFRRILSSIRHQ